MPEGKQMVEAEIAGRMRAMIKDGILPALGDADWLLRRTMKLYVDSKAHAYRVRKGGGHRHESHPLRGLIGRVLNGRAEVADEWRKAIMVSGGTPGFRKLFAEGAWDITMEYIVLFELHGYYWDPDDEIWSRAVENLLPASRAGLATRNMATMALHCYCERCGKTHHVDGECALEEPREELALPWNGLNGHIA